MRGSLVHLILRTSTDPVISFTIGPYYFNKNTAPVIDQDAGNWMLDTGLTRYSADFINRRRATYGASACGGRVPPFSSVQQPVTSNQYPEFNRLG